MHIMQLGRFHTGGQQYFLMTTDVMRQLHGNDSTYLPIVSVNIGNRMHVVQPVTNDTAGITDEIGKLSLRNSFRRRRRKGTIIYGSVLGTGAALNSIFI